MGVEDVVQDELHDASEGDEDDGSEELADISADGSRLKSEVFEELEGGREGEGWREEGREIGRAHV